MLLSLTAILADVQELARNWRALNAYLVDHGQPIRPFNRAVIELPNGDELDITEQVRAEITRQAEHFLATAHLMSQRELAIELAERQRRAQAWLATEQARAEHERISEMARQRPGDPLAESWLRFYGSPMARLRAQERARLENQLGPVSAPSAADALLEVDRILRDAREKGGPGV